VEPDVLMEPLPETRCEPDQLMEGIAVVRHNPEFKAAVFIRVADAVVEHTFTKWCKPRGGLAIQIARAFQALCTDIDSAGSAEATLTCAAERHPLQLLSVTDRSNFGEFFTTLFGDAKDAEQAAQTEGLDKPNAGTSYQLANLDALFFTPSVYNYLLANKKFYNMRNHVAEIGHLITHADGNPPLVCRP
jgi:hypothetical protein